MKKQTRYALVLLIIAACSVAVLIAGVTGLQNLNTRTETKRRQLQTKANEYERLEEQLKKKEEWEQELASLNEKLATLDASLVDYEYIPTYLAQIQRTAELTGNNIRSIRPRGVEVLDTSSPLLMASYERWLESNKEIAAAAKEKADDIEAPPATKKAAVATTTRRGKTPSEYKIQQFTLEIEGDYTSVVRLLDALRTFPKLIYIRSVSVSPPLREYPDRLKATLETYAIIPPDHYQPELKPVAIQPVEGVKP